MKTSNDEDQLEFSLNLDDIQKQKGLKKDQQRVIEQFFPDPSTLGPQLLVPDNQKRIFMQLDFAKEENIEDYYKQLEENVRRQTIQNQEEEEERKEVSIPKIPSGEKSDTENQVEEAPEKISEQQSEIIKSPSSSKENRIGSKTSVIKSDVVDDEVKEDELRKSSIETLHSDETVPTIRKSSPSISTIPSNTTIGLTPELTEL